MNIRNFVIIAHVDHGKSTLADRFLELTGTVPARKMKTQYLDQLELERERGITIKMAPVRMHWRPSRRLPQIETRINADDNSGELLYKDLTYKIRGALFSVYNSLGPGHKESVYQNSLPIEFTKRNLSFEREKRIDVIYEGKKVGLYQPDFVVEGKVIVELKALPFLGNPPKKQTRYYLRGSEYRLALLANFGAEKLEIERIIYDSVRNNQPPNQHQSAPSPNPRESALNPRESASLEYILNLIDTPGHSDFSYEVSRALRAVEGGILLVDVTQGIQAQTLSNLRAAKDAGLTLIAAVNKIDVYKSKNEEMIEKAVHEVSKMAGIPEKEVMRISGKTGEGVQELLAAVIEKIPPPKNIRVNQLSNQRESAVPARALIFDSFYDEHKGIIASVRVFSAKGGSASGGDGEFKTGNEIKLLGADLVSKVKEIGCFSPELKPLESLKPGEIGYIATGLRDPDKIKIGDTILTNYQQLTTNNLMLAGYKEPNPTVFVSFYPESNDEYEALKTGLSKLKLNDSALTVQPDYNELLGRGFTVGFLGRLHYEITAERLKREFKVRTVNTFPSVRYKVKISGNQRVDPHKSAFLIISKPEDLPENYEEIWEPMAEIDVLAPREYANVIFTIQNQYRIKNIRAETIENKVEFKAVMPISELISDFDDKLKSLTSGFASMSYEHLDYEKADIMKVDVLVAGKKVPGLSRFISKEKVEREARQMVEKLKKILPRQQFAQSLQAAVGSKIIAREDIPALRKNVTGHLYGGDRTRKMKLWKKQQRGKKKLKEMADVRITPEVFKELLKKE